jgi:2-polyprenyl-3-methyl-5-hydroxy-6-metoxy-1,4-benzoquinol methylase
MKNNVWYNKDIVPEQMLLGALGNLDGWVKLENSDHYPILNHLIKESNSEYLCDIGCGAGELGRLYNPTHKYVGYDLGHIIDKVALKLNPNLLYVSFDIHDFNYHDLMAYDLIVCNAFLTEMTNSEFILKNIIQNTKKSLIIHRQDFSDKANILPTKTYGNLESIRSVIEWSLLYKLLEGANLHIKEKHNTSSNSHSLLITKRQL